jgi:hypothetical protein
VGDEGEVSRLLIADCRLRILGLAIGDWQLAIGNWQLRIYGAVNTNRTGTLYSPVAVVRRANTNRP